MKLKQGDSQHDLIPSHLILYFPSCRYDPIPLCDLLLLDVLLTILRIHIYPMILGMDRIDDIGEDYRPTFEDCHVTGDVL